MSSSSYLGLKVRVTMTSGEVIEGVITDIDTATGSLRIGQQAIARANICDLQIVTAGADPGASLSVPASSRAQVSFADPAIVSSSRSLADGVVSSPAPPSVSSTSLLSSSSSSLSAAAVAPPFATARDAPLTSSAASSPKPTGRRAKAKGVVTRGGSNNPDSNSRNTEGKQGHGWDELTHSMRRHAQLSNKMEKSGRKGGGAGAQRYSNNHSSFYNGDNEQGDQESDLEEDFDFDAALGKFDKGKVWEEIRNLDQTDPSTLLVSHNRLPGLGGTRNRGAQDKLLPNEPVLSPSPPPALIPAPLSSEESIGEHFGTAGVQGREEQNGRKRRDSGKERFAGPEAGQDDGSELALLRKKAGLLETLLGVDLQLEASEGDGSTRWRVTVYETASKQLQAKVAIEERGLSPMMDEAKRGALCFGLGLYGGTRTGQGDKLRYLGTIDSLSDASSVARLPEHYRGEMGLKKEHAAIFFRRLKEYCSLTSAISMSSAT